MKRLAPVLVALLVASASEAKRAYREPENTPTGVVSDDGRVAAWGSGFLAVHAADGKAQILAYDADGKNEEELVASPAVFTSWRPSPKQDVIGWISAGHVHATVVADKSDRDLGETDGKTLAFSPDGKIVAFLLKSSLVLRDLSGGRHREIAPRENRRIDAFEFTGDGKWVMAVTSSALMDTLTATSAIERAPAAAESPAFAVLHEPKDLRITHAVPAPGTDQVAFVESKVGAKGGTLRIVELGSGEFHEFSAVGDYLGVAWDTDGNALLVSTRGRNGAVSCSSQALHKTGTMQQFWKENLSADGDHQDRFPVAGKSATWFLRFKADGSGKGEVVRATLK